MRSAVHLILHMAVPGLVARLAFPSFWVKAWLIMLATMVVDVDHLLASPIYDPGRCSIGFHPLHSWPAIVAWFGLAAWPRTRVVGVGLLIHMALDAVDCIWMALEP